VLRKHKTEVQELKMGVYTKKRKEEGVVKVKEGVRVVTQSLQQVKYKSSPK